MWSAAATPPLFDPFTLNAQRQSPSRRRLEDSPVFNELSTITIHELKVIDVDSSIFAIPSGLTYQEPVMAGPG